MQTVIESIKIILLCVVADIWILFWRRRIARITQHSL